MELRDIEIFLTLAEELHFGRTAERLHITPSRVSQSIKQQERRIGGTLFDRTTRDVRLTPLGDRLRRDLDAGYRLIVQGVEAAAAAARGVAGELTLGTMGPHHLLLEPVVELFQTRHPAARLRHREIQPPAPLDLLRSGDVDVALVWQPVHEPDLTVGPVTHTSSVLLMVGTEHPYARRDAITLEDLADCTIVRGHALPESMEGAMNPFHTPSGRPIPRGSLASTWHELLTAVASGGLTAVVSAEAADFYPWPNLAFVPISDAPPSEWALVWRTSRETPLVRALADVVRDVGVLDRRTP
ncbi:LysR family transcriptional regulator [Actinomadura atramentaria]|uniref:LysR family transcriptional regulator n=1 Tax=Actinomadura atramentaria TaxID=1990 RepID=UPI00037A648C|nr:LysR family transcriptional regulator [Actinomadura atramentaria]